MSKAQVNENSIIWFGKYKGKPVDIVVSEEPEYILLLERSKFFSVNRGLLLAAINRLPYNHWLVMEWKNTFIRTTAEETYELYNSFPKKLSFQTL